MVYVISKNGKPLMPCENVIARLLLKQGKAKVVKREPFTIKLLYETTEYTQPLTLGMDTGSEHIGTAVVNEKNEIIYASETEIRNDIKKRMDRRRKYRTNRRSRKTRYRKARFNNRKNSRKKDRFSPTIVSKIQAHVREIEFVRKILPVTKIVLETGTFDPHLLKNPEMNRHWGYQKGFDYGFANRKASILARDGHTCQHCKGKRKDSHLEVHHIVFRSNGGSDDENNLITLCHSCHKDLHDGKIVLKSKGKKSALKHATQMNSIRKQLLRIYPDAVETFGYVTKENRQALRMEKTHVTDACVIASGGCPVIQKTGYFLKKKCVPKGDYQQTKGVRSEKKIPTGKLFGFRKFDKLLYKGKEYFIKGRMQTGYCFLMDIEGKKQDFENPKTVKMQHCRRIRARNGILQEIHPLLIEEGVFFPIIR